VIQLHLWTKVLMLYCLLVVTGYRDGTEADPENCFGRGTLDLIRRRQQSQTPKVLWGD